MGWDGDDGSASHVLISFFYHGDRGSTVGVMSVQGFFLDVKSYFLALIFFSHKKFFCAKKSFCMIIMYVSKRCTEGFTRSATAPSQPMRGNACILRSRLFSHLSQSPCTISYSRNWGTDPICTQWPKVPRALPPKPRQCITTPPPPDLKIPQAPPPPPQVVQAPQYI